MKLQCTVIEDLLPVYIDGICSLESEKLIEDHLLQCPACREMLARMRSAEAQPPQIADEPLRSIGKRWQQGKRKAFQKGICLTLAVLLLTTPIWYAPMPLYVAVTVNAPLAEGVNVYPSHAPFTPMASIFT